ncbi:AAA family ATPase [Streptomyces alfalfae]
MIPHPRGRARGPGPRGFESLAALRDRQAGLLSGGEQQFLALLCALSLDARLLLIDEMTMGLAPLVARGLVDIVKEVAAEGVAVLFVERHLHIALELCDRAHVLSHGECVREGSGPELRLRIDELASLYFAGDPALGRWSGDPALGR